VESPKAGLPTFPRHDDLIWKTEFQKGGPEAEFRSPPGSSFD
jgi:hypothetical protein